MIELTREVVMRRLLLAALAAGLLLVPPGRATADEAPAYTRTEDVIYGRKYGTALTMDVFTPKKKANGAAVVLVVSGGWFSATTRSIRRRFGRGAAQARLHRLRRRPRQPAEVSPSPRSSRT